MAVTITSDEVKSGFSTTVAASEIDLLIAFIAGADTSLDAANVADGSQRLLKLYGIRHLLTLQANEGRGTVTNEKAPSGAGRAFNANKGEGIESTNFGKALLQMDKGRHVIQLIDNQTLVSLGSIGRRSDDTVQAYRGSY